MGQAYEMFLLRIESQGAGGHSSSDSYDVEPQIEESLDHTFHRFGRNTCELLLKLNVSFRRGNFWPWAIACFDREFRLAGHIASVRSAPTEVTLSAYSLPSEHSVARDGVPPVSILLFSSKAAASRLSTQSPLFEVCWRTLSSLSPSRKWICTVDSPDEKWVAEAEVGDDQLFMELYRQR